MRQKSKSVSVHDILAFIERCSGSKPDETPDDFTIERVATLHKIGPNCLSYAKKSKEDFLDQVPAINTALLLIPKDTSKEPLSPFVRVDNPRYLLGRIVEEFFAVEWLPNGISPKANIDESVTLGKDVRIGHNVTIAAGATIGDRTAICDGTIIGPNVKIGVDCVIRSCTVIGQPGFGTDKRANGKNYYLPHIGSVVIGDRVWIGALTTVCAGTIDPTIVEDDAYIDDHVHIAHNALIGSNALIAANSEVSGSTVIGKNVHIAPQVATMNGITIGDNSLLGLGTVVVKSQPENVVLVGNPARVLRKVDD